MGGALDLLLDFDLGPPSKELSGFGVAVRAPAGSVHGAAMRLELSVSRAAGGDGVRIAHLASTAPVVPPPNRRREVLPQWLNATDLDDWQSAGGSSHFPEDTSPAVCQELCEKNADCVAWTHERRHQGPGVECRLHTGKASHGAPVLPCPLPNKLCTSGAKKPLEFECLPKKSAWVTGGGDANFSVRVLPGEPLSLRLLVDRTIIELFAQGGRGALVAADQIFRLDHTTAYLFNTGTMDVDVNVSMYGMSCGWAAHLPKPKPLRTDDDAPVGWWTFDAADGSSVPDRAGHGSGRVDLAGTRRVSLGVASAPKAAALRIFGNSSSDSFSVSSSAIDLDEWTLSFWVDWLWGSTTLVQKGDQLNSLQLYDGYMKYEMHTAAGKIEDGPYPHQCGYLQPGAWQHVALTFSKRSGTATLFMDGIPCYNSSVKAGSLKSTKDALAFSSFSGLIADVRVYKRPLSAASVGEMHRATAAIYSSTKVNRPSPEEIEREGLGWRPFPSQPGDEMMHNSWLNFDHRNSDVDTATVSLAGARRILWAGERAAAGRPALRTALSELTAALPYATAVDFASLAHSNSLEEPGSVLIGTCEDVAIVRAIGFACPVLGDEAFALRVSGRRLVVAGGGDAGVLYSAFAVVRHAQLGTPWEAAAIDADESPSTSLRLLNHWSVWRGEPQDAWMPPRTNRSALPYGAFHEGGSSGPYDDGADRTDSIFSWADLADGPSANSTARIRQWARLLASVGINSLAPQDGKMVMLLRFVVLSVSLT